MDEPNDVVLDRAAVREVDRAAIEDFGIPGIVLMENAARGLADAALEMLTDAAHHPSRVLIVCGRGNNGGDGYALARHLANAGVHVTLVPLGDPRPDGDAGINAAICRNMDIPATTLDAIDDPASFDLIVDAMFGTGLDRAIEGSAAGAVAWINDAGRPVLAVDVPSGLDCDTGAPLGPTVRATVTVTFVAAKPGFAIPAAKPHVGRVVVVGIGAPASLVRRIAQRP